LPDINHEKIPWFCRELSKFDFSAMEADEQSLDWAFVPERRSRDIIPGLKRTNMSLRTELGFTVGT
jgi:hypothetical protein